MVDWGSMALRSASARLVRRATAQQAQATALVAFGCVKRCMWAGEYAAAARVTSQHGICAMPPNALGAAV